MGASNGARVIVDLGGVATEQAEDDRPWPEWYGRRLQQLLSAGQYDRVVEALEEMPEHDRVNPEEFRALAERLLLILTDIALREEMPLTCLQRFYGRLFDRNHTLCRSEEALRETLEAFAGELESFRRSRDGLLDRIKEYIALYGMNYDFSICTMAEYFQISLPELSHLFQSKTGLKLGAYLWNLRLEQAKHLLADTDYPIKEVVRLVGYVDCSSFTRRFRCSTGCTPGEYRDGYGRVTAVNTLSCLLARK